MTAQADQLKIMQEPLNMFLSLSSSSGYINSTPKEKRQPEIQKTMTSFFLRKREKSEEVEKNDYGYGS